MKDNDKNKVKNTGFFQFLFWNAQMATTMPKTANSATNHHALYTWIRAKSEPCSFSMMVPAASTVMSKMTRTEMMCRRYFMVFAVYEQFRCKYLTFYQNAKIP